MSVGAFFVRSLKARIRPRLVPIETKLLGTAILARERDRTHGHGDVHRFHPALLHRPIGPSILAPGAKMAKVGGSSSHRAASSRSKASHKHPPQRAQHLVGKEKNQDVADEETVVQE